MPLTDEDFCLMHGREFMKCDRGPIPYCNRCEEEAAYDPANDPGNHPEN